MMTVTTDKGKTYEVISASLAFNGTFVILMYESRRIAEIAQEFDGVKQFIYEETEQGVRQEYNDFSLLSSIIDCPMPGMVQIVMAHEKGE